jgi:3-hydroxyisobutyrate dehydrogenase-like beta-hydroxyacid dehydrogenase
MKRIAIIGVGLLGTAVASRLLERGFEVTGYDTRPEPLQAMCARGLRPVASVAEAAAGADAVFTILPSLDSVDTVMRGAGGLFETATRGSALIQMSTISPDLARRLGKEAATRGLGFLDAPVSGTSAMVARGDCMILVGGDAPRLDACRPLFDAIARRTIHIGAVGTASLTKLVLNLLVGLHTAALAEALVLGTKGGLSPTTLLDIVQESAASSRMAEIRGPLMVSHRFEPQMKVDLFSKDFALMLEEGRRLGVPLPLTAITHQLCTATSAGGRGSEDLASMISTLETLAGV